MKNARYLSSAPPNAAWLKGLLFCIVLSACATPPSGPVAPMMPSDMQNLGRGIPPGRSVSAMEALSRGMAAVTPPEAELQDVYYEFDSINLRADAEETLKQNAQWIRANPATRVEIEGHCDDIGSDEYNLALGAKRAQIAKDFLVSQGIQGDRLVTISYGKEAPACFEPTSDCRVKNRRARFVVFNELPTSYTNVR